MVSPGVAPFAHGAVEGMELSAGGPAYGHVPVDPSFVSGEPHMFRTGSDVAGASTARVESRVKARERARERAKEKQHTGTAHPLERDAPPRYMPSSTYANLPAQVSSALQHPFQAPFVNQRQPHFHPAPSFNYPEAFPSSAYGYPSYAPSEPSPSSLPSVSHYFVENPPGALAAGRYPTSGPQPTVPSPNFPGFAAGSPSLRPGASSFSSLLNEPQYSGFPSQGYYSPYPSQPRPTPSALLGQSPGSRLPAHPAHPSHQAGGHVYPPQSSHLVRPGHDQPPLHSTTPHSLDPNYYNPQLPTRLPGFEELEEEFKP